MHSFSYRVSKTKCTQKDTHNFDTQVINPSSAVDET